MKRKVYFIQPDAGDPKRPALCGAEGRAFWITAVGRRSRSEQVQERWQPRPVRRTGEVCD